MSGPPPFDPNYKYVPDENENENENENEESEDDYQETRPRSDALNVLPEDISEQPPHLGRQVSLEAQSQRGEGSCFAHSSARVITKLITKIIPQYFSLNETDKELLNDSTRSEINKNCFVTSGSQDIQALRNILSPKNYTSQKCPIDKKYNTLIIYYYTYLTIRRKFGCEGGHENMVLENFVFDVEGFYGLRSEVQTTKDGLLKNSQGLIIYPTGFLISGNVDGMCRYLIIQFINELITNKIELEVETIDFPINRNINYNENWITDIPDKIKESLNNGLYVCFSYKLASKQRYKVTPKFYPTPVSPCVEKTDSGDVQDTISGHAVVITNWEPSHDKKPAYVTIVNSWGTSWGASGFIRVPSTTYDQFVLNPTCPEYNILNMTFSYFVVNTKNGEPYTFPTLGTKTRPRFIESKGGTTNKNKRKTKRCKNKRKTKRCKTRRH